MAFTTYEELKTAIGDWLARDDLTANIPDFITLFEAEACRRLRVRETETTATLTPSSGSCNLPSDFLSVRRLTWDGSSSVELGYMHPGIFKASWPTLPSGTPANYTIEAGAIKIAPTDTTTLTLLYRAKTAAVSGTLNWLFTSHPDAYLCGSLVEAYMFNKDTDNAAVWKTRLEGIFKEIEASDFYYRGPMAIRVVGATP